jgi:hypothetical protein
VICLWYEENCFLGGAQRSMSLACPSTHQSGTLDGELAVFEILVGRFYAFKARSIVITFWSYCGCEELSCLLWCSVRPVPVRWNRKKAIL